MTRRVTAIIVTYNSSQEIGGALDGLRPMIDRGDLDCVVVDNASVDDTREVVRQRSWVELVTSPTNVGYGRGLNIGLARARAPYVLFMNPDAVITCENLERLCDFLDSHPRAGIVGPAIVDEIGSLQAAGVPPSPLSLMARAVGLRRWTRRQRPIVPGGSPFSTDWLVGAILLARTQLMQDLGGFDPRFFLYFEETDLCRRVMRAGHELWAVGEATAMHIGSVSARKSGQQLFGDCIAEHYFRSRFYYLRKHFGWLAAALTEIVEWFALLVRACINRMRGRTDDRGLSIRMAGPYFSMPAKVGDKSTDGEAGKPREGVGMIEKDDEESRGGPSR